MNGTIKEINLDPTGKDLKQKLVNDKASLIGIFEEIFGSNKPQPTAMLGARSDTNFAISGFAAADTNQRAGLKSAGMAVRPKRSVRPPLAKSMQNFADPQHMDYRDIDHETAKGSNNPLKMVKEYKSQAQYQKISVGKQSQSAYGSNASTGAYLVNDEQDRVNRIMHEPIENLLTNMNNLSRPVSSKHTMNMLRASRRMPPYKAKKERAMTAGHDKGMPGRGQGALKIAESAYHIGKQHNQLNQAYSGFWGDGNQNATSWSGQVGSKFPHQYNQSAQNLGQNPLKQN